jgi:hypothetical protein
MMTRQDFQDIARFGASGYPAPVTSNMSSRALPFAVVGLSLVFFWALVAYAINGGGNLTDPADILTQGAQATAEGDSFHVSVGVTGGMSDPGSGMNVPLDGVTVEGDVDVAAESAHVTFAVPGLFGLSGEAIVIGPDTYLMTSMTGDKWVHTASDQAGGDDSGSHEPPTDSEIGDKVNEFLATEGVTAETLDETACGDDTCYHVQVTVSSEALLQHYLDSAAGGSGDSGPMSLFGVGTGMDPADLLRGPLVVDLLIQQNGLWLRSVSAGADAGGPNATTFTVNFSNWNQSVDISAPPADQITEEGDFSLFQ